MPAARLIIGDELLKADPSPGPDWSKVAGGSTGWLASWPLASSWPGASTRLADEATDQAPELANLTDLKERARRLGSSSSGSAASARRPR